MNVQTYNGVLSQLTVAVQKNRMTGMNIIFDVSGLFFEAQNNKQQGAVSALKSVHFTKLTRLLHDCAVLGHRLFIISDWSKEWFDFLQADPSSARLLNFFDDIILAEICGFKKTDPRMFDYILRKHRLDPRHCILIDKEKQPLEAAAKVGITKTILCTDLTMCQVRKDLELHGVL